MYEFAGGNHGSPLRAAESARSGPESGGNYLQSGGESMFTLMRFTFKWAQNISDRVYNENLEQLLKNAI
jgi:hypothetical protein